MPSPGALSTPKPSDVLQSSSEALASEPLGATEAPGDTPEGPEAVTTSETPTEASLCWLRGPVRRVVSVDSLAALGYVIPEDLLWDRSNNFSIPVSTIGEEAAGVIAGWPGFEIS